jgi:hypothetical protein
MAYEESGVHHAQEYENRFWTIFASLFSTALFFAKDSPIAFGLYNPSLGFVGVLLASYAMHVYDRHIHRVNLSRQTKLRRSLSLNNAMMSDHKVTGEEQLSKIDVCLRDIDQLLIPSTINNFLNRRFVLKKEREILAIFLDCDATTLNYIICHVKLALLVYKIKDHGYVSFDKCFDSTVFLSCGSHCLTAPFVIVVTGLGANIEQNYCNSWQ